MVGICTTIESPNETGWEDHVTKVLTNLVNDIPKAAKKALVNLLFLSLLSKVITVHMPTGSL
jgi:hypothetical protein